MTLLDSITVKIKLLLPISEVPIPYSADYDQKLQKEKKPSMKEEGGVDLEVR